MKNYGKKLMGGAMVVGASMKKAAQWPGNQIAKEFMMQDEQDKKNAKKGKALNKAYSFKKGRTNVRIMK